MGHYPFKIEVYDTEGEVICKGSEEVEVKQVGFAAYFKLEGILKDPKRAKISFDGEVFILPITQHRLHGWFGQQAVFLDFSPMSLTLLKTLIENGTFSEDIWPKLNKGNVKVYVNDEEFEILTFIEYPEYVGPDTPARNGYLIAIDKNKFLGVEDPVVRVLVTYPVELDDETIIEKGEGIFLGFLKSTGV
jgi:hypothetical protein